MKINIEWTSIWKDSYSGFAIITEPCCKGFQVGDEFSVRKEEGILYALLSQEYDDAISFPLSYCPVCGHPVVIISEEIMPRQPMTFISSGSIFIKTEQFE